MKNDDENLVSAGTGCILTLLSIPISIALKLFVGSKFWEWFIEPTFKISVPSAAMGYGLILAVSLWYTPRNSKTKNETTLESGVYTFLISLITPLFSLLMGYIVLMLVRNGY